MTSDIPIQDPLHTEVPEEMMWQLSAKAHPLWTLYRTRAGHPAIRVCLALDKNPEC